MLKKAMTCPLRWIVLCKYSCNYETSCCGLGSEAGIMKKTSQKLRILSSVTLNCQLTKIVIQVLNCQNCNQCLKCHKSLGLSNRQCLCHFAQDCQKWSKLSKNYCQVCQNYLKLSKMKWEAVTSEPKRLHPIDYGKGAQKKKVEKYGILPHPLWIPPGYGLFPWKISTGILLS